MDRDLDEFIGLAEEYAREAELLVARHVDEKDARDRVNWIMNWFYKAAIANLDLQGGVNFRADFDPNAIEH